MSIGNEADGTPDSADGFQAHLIWWPDECHIPFFAGEVGARTVVLPGQAPTETQPLDQDIRGQPAFELRRHSDGARMAVYADGRSEGFPDGYTITINRIPILIWSAVARSRNSQTASATDADLGPHLSALRDLP